MDLSNLLGGLSPQQFLQEYWQKKPLLIRNALPGFTSPISPEELAGLACEEEVESRILLQQSDHPQWELRHGHFQEQDFTQLPESHWTLLVQDAEKHVPQLEPLVFAFHFIPHWRIDDLMISYAPEGGSVGPHADAYDVFLLQGLGQRRWQISEQTLQRQHLIPDLDLEILSHFEPEQEWVLNPGDMLYLPPNVIHHGVALNDCMTYSIGFRAPRQYDLLQSYMDFVLESIEPTKRYSDSNLQPSNEPFRLEADAIETIKELLFSSLPQHGEGFNRWLGSVLTEPKIHLESLFLQDELDTDSFVRNWQEHNTLIRHTACRLLYIRDNDRTLLFANGKAHPLPEKLAYLAHDLCNKQELHYSSLETEAMKNGIGTLMCTLYNSGCFYFDEE